MTTSQFVASGLPVPSLLEGEWSSAIISTYGVDLRFFEAQLLSQLAQIRLRLILADNTQLAESFAEAKRTGQRLRSLNRTYVITPIRHRYAAHAKMILLLGPATGRLLVGSGNLGYDGYAGTGEMWKIYSYSDDDPRHLAEFASARCYVDGLIRENLVDSPIGDLVRAAWGQSTWLVPATGRESSLISNEALPLLQQLRQRVTEPVEEMILHAPFFDEQAIALRTAIETFTPKRVRLLISKNTSADPKAIDRVLTSLPRAHAESIEIVSEPNTFIHAKWIHLIHGTHETILSGSANLSRSALLSDYRRGNIELGMVTSGTRGAFAALYSHLRTEQIVGASALDIEFKSDQPTEAVDRDTLVILWSAIEGATLTLVFNRGLDEPVRIELVDYGSRPLPIVESTTAGDKVTVTLTADSAVRVVDGGRVDVILDGAEDRQSIWPLQLSRLHERLRKVTDTHVLLHVADLSGADTELQELLVELERTLIIDRSSAWRIARPTEPEPSQAGDAVHMRLSDLDWDRVRRDPRHTGYLLGRAPSGIAPTDIQIVLAAIAGRLGDVGLDGSETADDEAELAHEGDMSAAETADEDEDDAEEQTQRSLPVSTLTRMAFNRFIRRYVAGLEDDEFLRELGPVAAVTNAAIFGHVLWKLLSREGAVKREVAVDALIRTWSFLWGPDGVLTAASDLDAESQCAIDNVLEDANLRVRLLQNLGLALDEVLDEDTRQLLQYLTHQVILNATFGLDANLLITAGRGWHGAQRIMDRLFEAARPFSESRVRDLVMGPLGLAASASQWIDERVVRPGGRETHVTTLIVREPVPHLTLGSAVQALCNTAIAALYVNPKIDYFRINFAGNGTSNVAYWDETAHSGYAVIDGDDLDIDVFEPDVPAWKARWETLNEELDAGRVESA